MYLRNKSWLRWLLFLLFISGLNICLWLELKVAHGLNQELNINHFLRYALKKIYFNYFAIQRFCKMLILSFSQNIDFHSIWDGEKCIVLKEGCSNLKLIGGIAMEKPVEIWTNLPKLAKYFKQYFLKCTKKPIKVVEND